MWIYDDHSYISYKFLLACTLLCRLNEKQCHSRSALIILLTSNHKSTAYTIRFMSHRLNFFEFYLQEFFKCFFEASIQFLFNFGNEFCEIVSNLIRYNIQHPLIFQHSSESAYSIRVVLLKSLKTKFSDRQTTVSQKKKITSHSQTLKDNCYFNVRHLNAPTQSI